MLMDLVAGLMQKYLDITVASEFGKALATILTIVLNCIDYLLPIWNPQVRIASFIKYLFHLIIPRQMGYGRSDLFR